ncbi:MAG TPA: glycosyltransferase, partial [Patescibacteria group bacterium]
MKYPFLSIIIPTLNNEKDLPLLFSSLNKQVYPKDKLEIIVSDGGSKDSTKNIAKKNNALVIHNTKVLAEPGVELGMKKAKGELLMILAVDNIFEEEDSLKKIASCFSDSHIYAAFPRHESNNSDTLFTKYI